MFVHFVANNAAVAKLSQRRFVPGFAPRFRQFGGASRLSRRGWCRKSRNLAAVPWLLAVPFGGKNDKFAAIAINSY